MAKVPGASVQALLDTARGEVSLAAGDARPSIDTLASVAGRLPVRGQVGRGSAHMRVWFSLASACIAAGRDDDAVKWLERVTSAGHERRSDYVAYVRSHYLLAQLYEKRGDRARANQLYGRFLDYWRDGDMDRANVAEAQRELGS